MYMYIASNFCHDNSELVKDCKIFLQCNPEILLLWSLPVIYLTI